VRPRARYAERVGTGNAPGPGRSIAAVVAGIVLVALLGRVLLQTLVNAAAGGPIADVAAWVAVRNRTPVLVGWLVSHIAATFFAGYMTARIARCAEVQHAAIAGVLQALILVGGFSSGEAAAIPPFWIRAAIVVATIPAMVAGAAVRARAR
jgi:hypothetical protein